MKTLFSILLLTAQLSIAGETKTLPAPIARAMTVAHTLAKQASVINLNMLNYVYFKSEFCKKAVKPCTNEEIEKQLPIWQGKIGSAFETEMAKYEAYKNELEILSAKYPIVDVTGFISATNFQEIMSRRTFITGLDYTKVVAGLSLRNGFKAQNLRVFVMMVKSVYEKMCPTRNGQPAILPRPSTQIMLAYKSRGIWYALNTQNANLEVVELGRRFPDRLQHEFQLSAPAWLVGQQLVYAGHYDVRHFSKGFPGQYLVNITASGRMSADSRDFICL